MGQKAAYKRNDSPNDSFVRELRGALNHLYDPDALRLNMLAEVFGVSGRFDTPTAMQNLLIKAIESLKPAPGATNRAHAQGVYELLLYRYVQQFNQDEIANQLGISVRHLRRQQNLAVYELATRLWNQYALGEREERWPTSGALASAGNEAGPLEDDGLHLNGELNWLKFTSRQTTTNLALALPEVLNLISPLAEQKQTPLIAPEAIEGLILVHPVAFQQIVLNLLSMAIQMACGSEVRLEIREGAGQQTIEITGRRTKGNCNLPQQEELAWLATVGRLVELSQGTLSYPLGEGRFQAGVTFPSVEPVVVLVVDDNPEIVTMMQRFAVETRYRMTGVSDPKTAIDQALRLRPDLVVLDIMMPQVDGLQLLSHFKHHPELGSLPVIICSVLPQKDLAASLGANGFVQKPFTRDDFIAALERTDKRAAH